MSKIYRVKKKDKIKCSLCTKTLTGEFDKDFGYIDKFYCLKCLNKIKNTFNKDEMVCHICKKILIGSKNRNYFYHDDNYYCDRCFHKMQQEKNLKYKKEILNNFKRHSNSKKRGSKVKTLFLEKPESGESDITSDSNDESEIWSDQDQYDYDTTTKISKKNKSKIKSNPIDYPSKKQVEEVDQVNPEDEQPLSEPVRKIRISREISITKITETNIYTYPNRRKNKSRSGSVMYTKNDTTNEKYRKSVGYIKKTKAKHSKSKRNRSNSVNTINKDKHHDTINISKSERNIKTKKSKPKKPKSEPKSNKSDGFILKRFAAKIGRGTGIVIKTIITDIKNDLREEK